MQNPSVGHSTLIYVALYYVRKSVITTSQPTMTN